MTPRTLLFKLEETIIQSQIYQIWHENYTYWRETATTKLKQPGNCNEN